MSKTETLRQLSAAANENRLANLMNQIETVHESKVKSAQELAETLEPLAQAMAALTDETRQSLGEIAREIDRQSATFTKQIEVAVQSWNMAATQAQQAAEKLNQAGQRMEWIHYALAAVIGILSAVLMTVFLRWLAPPIIENRLDSQAIAELLKPFLIELSKRSRSK